MIGPRALKTVYFVRHAESEANTLPIFQPPTAPLTENGKAQTKKIAERIAKLSFDALISSPFARAKDTAIAIEELTGKKVEYSDLFKERVKPSSINGKSYTDEKAVATWRAWDKSLYTSGLRAEDGENFDDILTRVDQALDFLTERPEKELVVVTHGFFLRALIARVLFGNFLSGEAHRNFQLAVDMENTGITILHFKGGFEEKPHWQLWVFNDHSHLG